MTSPSPPAVRTTRSPGQPDSQHTLSQATPTLYTAAQAPPRPRTLHVLIARHLSPSSCASHTRSTRYKHAPPLNHLNTSLESRRPPQSVRFPCLLVSHPPLGIDAGTDLGVYVHVQPRAGSWRVRLGLMRWRRGWERRPGLGCVPVSVCPPCKNRTCSSGTAELICGELLVRVLHRTDDGQSLRDHERQCVPFPPFLLALALTPYHASRTPRHRTAPNLLEARRRTAHHRRHDPLQRLDLCLAALPGEVRPNSCRLSHSSCLRARETDLDAGWSTQNGRPGKDCRTDDAPRRVADDRGVPLARESGLLPLPLARRNARRAGTWRPGKRES